MKPNNMSKRNPKNTCFKSDAAQLAEARTRHSQISSLSLDVIAKCKSLYGLVETMSSVSEAACSYAALILHDDGIPITAEKIATLVKSANVSVESYWPSLFAKLFEKCNIEDLITNVGAGGGGAPVAAAAPIAAGGGGGAAAPPPAEEKKDEPEEQSDDDMGFSLFD
ncbi:hypothetical protein CRYUN_Cryun23aG0121300 [Craigia yunnanensis]